MHFNSFAVGIVIAKQGLLLNVKFSSGMCRFQVSI